MLVKVMVLQAGKPDADDRAFTPETLRAVAQKNSGLFSYQSRVLYAHVELKDKAQLERVRKQAYSMAVSIQGD